MVMSCGSTFQCTIREGGTCNEDGQNAGNPHRSRSGVNIAFRDIEQVVPCDVRTRLDLYRDSIKDC